MKLIVGLGNPGEKYESTRHNLGFITVDRLFKDLTPVNSTNWVSENKFKSDIAQLKYKPKKGEFEKVILVRPQTFMNNSGMAVSLLASYYKIDSSDIWIVYDELDLPLGNMKIRFGGAAAGHHGVEDIIEKLRTDKFWRFRLGIGQTKLKTEIADQKMRNAEDYVLGTFGKGDSGKIRDLVKRAAKSLETALEEGMPAAMNQYNSK